MPIITKELALKIAKKLKAEIKNRPGRPHDLACIYEDGLLIAQFGLRRGSKKNLGHDHVPNSLFISPHDAREIGICNRYRDWYIKTLRKKGYIKT